MSFRRQKNQTSLYVLLRVTSPTYSYILDHIIIPNSPFSKLLILFFVSCNVWPQMLLNPKAADNVVYLLHVVLPATFIVHLNYSFFFLLIY